MRGHLKSALIGVDNSEPPGVSLQFRQTVENMDVWSANSGDISFVITFASPTGPGFHGRRGFFASWRPLYSSAGAVKVIGSPFNTFEDAKAACTTMFGILEETAQKNW
jgi:hypothetical protein